jgi:heptosyltransferase I
MLEQAREKRMLLVRLDRIGDLVLTLPVDQSLEEQLHPAEIRWWIPKGLKFVTDLASPSRLVKEITKNLSFSQFFGLFRELKKERYDIVIVYHAPWWMSLLAWLARIPVRGGVRSQWHSFLFLNRTLRQKRSRAENSELEYNYLLTEALLELEPNKLHRHRLRLISSPLSPHTLGQWDLGPRQYFVVHPGMGGSALNWPTEKYAELIATLAQETKVVITGTAADEAFLAPLKNLLQGQLKENFADASLLQRIIWADGKLKGDELISILASARAVVAPSTGVLHLAASTGVPTVGIFSPVRVQQPRRWGPQGDHTTTVLPPIKNCPGELSCLETKCQHFPCMNKITVSDLLSALAQLGQVVQTVDRTHL